MNTVVALHAAVVGLLSLLGAHRAALLWLYFRHRRRAAREVDPLPDEALPAIVVQLPVYDEPAVVERLVDAAAALDWPRDRLLIQVLDDSDDGTPVLAARAVARARARGIDARHVRRGSRVGFKAGALAAGLEGSQAVLAAVFDADFIPPADFLKRAAPHFADPRVAVVQGRWTHLDARRSLLTRAQATLLDGHFVLDHGARHRAGRFFNFNGSAGVWRTAAIHDSGGWQGDTLTEDLDLSYRAQLRGWRFVYLPTLTCPGELPGTAAAWKGQQHRWAKGSIETARKLLPAVLRAPLPVAVRAEACAHLLTHLAHPLMLALLVLAPLSVRARDFADPGSLPAVDALVFLLSTATLLVFYGVAVHAAGGPGRLARFAEIPFVLSFGLAMSVNGTRAVWEAARGRRTAFARTPKQGLGPGRVVPPGPREPAGQLAAEVALGTWCTLGVAEAAARGAGASAALLAFLGAGPAYLAWRSVADRVGARSRVERRGRAVPAGPVPARRRASQASAARIGIYSAQGTHPGSDQLAGSAAEYPSNTR